LLDPRCRQHAVDGRVGAELEKREKVPQTRLCPTFALPGATRRNCTFHILQQRGSYDFTHVATHMGVKAVVGIEIEITRLAGKAKLSQNKERMLGRAMLAAAEAKEIR
jgi:hypothetical protein